MPTSPTIRPTVQAGPTRRPVPAPTSTSTPTPLTCDERDGSPPPQLSSAVFSGTGGQLVVDFDRPASQVSPTLGAAPCHGLVIFVGAAAATCEWTSTTRIVATLDAHAIVLAGDVVSVAAGGVIAFCATGQLCDCWPTAPARGGIAVLPPSKPLLPVIVVQAPDAAAVCRGLALDAVASQGSGGRGMRYEWSVVAVEPLVLDATALLAAVAAADGAKLVLAAESIAGVASSTVSFGLRLTNFLGFEASRTAAKVSIIDEAIPSVVFVGGTFRAMLRPDRLTVSVSAAVSGCNGAALSTAKLTYSWRILEQPQLASTSVDARQFNLPAYSLAASTRYTLVVTVSDAAGRSNSAAMMVTVGASEIAAVLDYNGAFVVGSAETFTLDAAESRDPDRGADAEASKGALRFDWSARDADTGEAVDISTGSSKVAIDASRLAPGRSYVVAVSVSDASDASRSARVTATAVVSAAARVPNVALQVAVSKVNPSTAVTFVGRVDARDAALELEWTLKSGILAAPFATLEQASLTAVAGIAVIQGMMATRYLKLRPGTLVPGRTYVFELSAVDPASSVTGSAVLGVAVNSRPTSGSLRVEPESGKTLLTEFSAVAANWVDDVDDLPLIYSFFFMPAGGAVEYPLKPGQLSPELVPFKLPAGPADADGAVHVLCDVADSLGATARATVRVFVVDDFPSVAALAKLTKALLAAAFDAGDIEVVFQVLNAAGATLAAPNCSLDCGALDRETCTADDAETCGACVAGFKGQASPSTNACVIDDGDGCGGACVGGDGCGGVCSVGVSCGGACSVGVSCSVDADCVFDACVAGECIAPLKRCPSDCSSSAAEDRGVCEFIDVSSDNARIEECFVGENWCAARCACFDGFFGAACQYDAVSYDEVLDLTASLVDSLSDAAASQDADAAAGNQAAATLQLVSASACDLVESGSLAVAQGTALALAASAARAGVVGDTAQLLVATLSSFVAADACPATSRRRLNRRRLAEGSDDTSGMIGPAVDDITAAMLLTAVAGEAASTAVSDNVRVAGQRFDAAAMLGASLSAPLTAAEVAAGVQPATMTMPRHYNVSANDTAVDMQLVQFGSNPIHSTDTSLNRTFTTLPIRAAVYGLSASFDGGTPSQRRPSTSVTDADGSKPVLLGGSGGSIDPDRSFSITLQRAKPLAEARNVTQLKLTCPVGFVGSVNATCPGAEESLVLDCTGTLVAQVVFINCTRVRVDVCFAFVGGFWDSHLCHADLARSNAQNLTCVCPYNAVRGCIDVAASLEMMVYYYADTLKSTFSTELVTKSVLMLWTYGTLLTATLLAMAFGAWRDCLCRDAADSVTPAEAYAFPGTPVDCEAFVSEKVREGLVDNAGTQWLKALAAGHSHLSFFWYDEKVPSTLRAFAIAFEWVTFLFAQAVAYFLAFPVGACEAIKGRSECETVASPMNPKVPLCRFVVESYEGTCSYVTPESTSLLSPDVVLVVLLATFVCLPFLKLFYYVVENVLLAPTLMYDVDEDDEPEDGLRKPSEPPPPKKKGEPFDLAAVLASIRRLNSSESWREKLTDLATHFEGHLDDFDAHAFALPASDLVLTPEWRQKARGATWRSIVAALARKEEIDDAIFDLDDGAWLPDDCTSSGQEFSFRRDLCRVRLKLVRDWHLKKVSVAQGRPIVTARQRQVAKELKMLNYGLFTKSAYARTLQLHAKAQVWGSDLAKCAPGPESETQLLIFTRLENLGRREARIYGQLYSTSVLDDAGRAPVHVCRKAAWTFTLVGGVALMVWWTLSVLLSLREAEGAAIVRTWWRMAIFSQILRLVIFEPLFIFVFRVLLPLTLSGKLRVQGCDPASKLAFPWATPLLERATTILADEYSAEAPIVSRRITPVVSRRGRGAATPIVLRRLLVRHRGSPSSVATARSLLLRQVSHLAVGDAGRRKANRDHREATQWRAGFISTFVQRHVAWRRPVYAQLVFTVLAIFVLLEEHVQELLVEEAITGLYLALSWQGVVRLPDSLAGTLVYHAILPAAMLGVSLGPLGIRNLAARARRREPELPKPASPAHVYRVYVDSPTSSGGGDGW
ncbi:REJ domain-containing protein [Pelagophyceae sp. CCMP2097]|nr:REJ domain-containing protein [Pelagophyceae sp. CCMP2097]